MKTPTVTLEMIGTNATPVLEQLICEAPNGSTIVFEEGVYPLLSAVDIRGKQGLILDGRGAILAPFFDREVGADNGSEVFHMLDCKDIIIRNFIVSSTLPVNSSGRILNVTEEYAEVEMNSRIPFTGDEQFLSGMTFDEEWRPTLNYWIITDYDPSQRTVIAGEIPCSAPKKLGAPHEKVGEQRFKVYSKNLAGLEAGMRCNVSHSYYGLVAFIFRQCEGITFENVKMENFGGFGFAVLPCCRDFTFKRVSFRTSDRIHQPFALNSDGIHLTGLTGKLIIEDCDFDSIGDDPLNVHTQVMTVSEVDVTGVKLIYNKINGVISPYWSKEGDLLRVYDPVTLELKGKVTVASAEGGNISLLPSGVAIEEGDYVTNDKYYPEITIKNCRFTRYRGRALCLQGASSLNIEDCTFDNASTCTVYLSTAFDYWMEAGPISNVTVKNNTFIGNGKWHNDPGQGVIFVRVNGERHQNIAPIHKNVRIESNRFENVGGTSIVVHLTDGVTVRDNTFAHCNNSGQNIVIERSNNVVCSNNVIVDR